MTKSEKFQLVENYIVENQNAHYRLAYSYVKNKESALDIIQESIMKALKSIDSLEQIQYLKTWFYRILINTSIDFINKNKRMVVVEDEVLDFHPPITKIMVFKNCSFSRNVRRSSLFFSYEGIGVSVGFA